MKLPKLSALRSAAAPASSPAFLLLLLGGLCYSCCGPGQLVKTPDKAFVQMSRAMHGTVATEYLTYVSHDGTLSSVQKLNRADTVADWEFAIRQAEALLAAHPTLPTVPAPVLTEPAPAAVGGQDE